MKVRKIRVNGSISLVFIFCLIGCSQIRPISTFTESKISPTETPLPTQSPLQETIMIQRLLSAQCVFPCYLGIIPGVTSIVDANSIMNDIGAVYIETNKINIETFIEPNIIGLKDYFYFLHLGESPQKDNKEKSVGYYQGINLFVQTEKIVMLSFSINIDSNYIISQQYWDKYSIGNILVKYGNPDNILFYIDKGIITPRLYFEMLFYYNKEGIVIHITGFGDNNQLCFDIAHIKELDMTLTDVASKISIFNPYWVPPSNNEYYSPINNILGIDIPTFVNNNIADSNACYKLLSK